jgi:hypothetical protein
VIPHDVNARADAVVNTPRLWLKRQIQLGVRDCHLAPRLGVKWREDVSIYVTTSAEDVWLERWSIRESDKGERHFLGYDVLSCDCRVSTPIATFDQASRTGTTASGSRYRLVGRAGRDSDAEYVWGVASKVWGIKAWKDVTGDLVPDWRRAVPLSGDDETDGDGDGGHEDGGAAA